MSFLKWLTQDVRLEDQQDEIGKLKNEIERLNSTLDDYKERNRQLESMNDEYEKSQRELGWIKRLLNDDDAVDELFDAAEKVES